MGKPSDMLTRTTEMRTNDRGYQVLIKKARRLIFQLGKKITSKNISDLLQDQSWVPTRASEGSTHILFNVAYPLITRTHFLSVSQLRTLFLIFSSYLLLTSSTSLNLEYGKQYLYI